MTGSLADEEFEYCRVSALSIAMLMAGASSCDYHHECIFGATILDEETFKSHSKKGSQRSLVVWESGPVTGR